jgi:hypothetical protein
MGLGSGPGDAVCGWPEGRRVPASNAPLQRGWGSLRWSLGGPAASWGWARPRACPWLVVAWPSCPAHHASQAAGRAGPGVAGQAVHGMLHACWPVEASCALGLLGGDPLGWVWALSFSRVRVFGGVMCR